MLLLSDYQLFNLKTPSSPPTCKVLQIEAEFGVIVGDISSRLCSQLSLPKLAGSQKVSKDCVLPASHVQIFIFVKNFQHMQLMRMQICVNHIIPIICLVIIILLYCPLQVDANFCFQRRCMYYDCVGGKNYSFILKNSITTHFVCFNLLQFWEVWTWTWKNAVNLKKGQVILSNIQKERKPCFFLNPNLTNLKADPYTKTCICIKKLQHRDTCLVQCYIKNINDKHYAAFFIYWTYSDDS